MNLLVDTHVALWAITDNPKLSQKARELILSPRTNVWISAANIWEIAIEAEHAIAVEDLPLHHHDPFDRILVAQALVEPMRLMTHDSLVALYSDTIIKI